MKDREYRIMYEIEHEFWWFKALRKLYAFSLNQLPKKENLKILDAGCGTGENSKLLSEYGEVYSLDLSELALSYAKRKGNERLVLGSVSALPFKKNSFDLVLASDVIYHRWVDDRKAMEEFYRVLKPKGYLLVNTASYEFMKSQHDEAVMTRLRYTKRGLKNLLRARGFRIKNIFYWNSLLFVPLVVMRFLKLGKTDHSDLKKISPQMNKMLLDVLNVECSLIKKNISFPFGLSVMCLAEKV